MIFTRPWMLLFLLLPAALIVWETRRTGHPVRMPFDHGNRRSSRWLRSILLVTSCLPALVLAVAVFVLAGPARKGLPTELRDMTNVEFCLDVSPSMMADFGEGTQYEAAMAAIGDFTRRREGDSFGLTIFGNEVLRWVPLTKDMSAVRSATPFLRPGSLPNHFYGTRIGKALEFCMKTLCRQEKGDRLIILLSDGESADFGGDVPRKLGKELRDANIMLYAIHIGSRSAPGALYTVVAPTGGQVYEVGDPRAMQRVFEHIDMMRPVKIKPGAAQLVDDFHIGAMVGLVALALYACALYGLRYTPW